jgi:protein tyrosine/serine phosphatase
VFHCSAGKDRTGVLAAVLLSLLGVADVVIAEDYGLSAAAMEKLDEWQRAQPEAGDAMVLQPKTFLACPPQAMLTFLAQLRERFGSVEGYVREVGVPASTVGRLRATLLER